jgi:hypothetical protein
MKRLWFAACAAACISCFSSVGWCEEPQKVTVCQLKADPASYNHKLVEVEASVSLWQLWLSRSRYRSEERPGRVPCQPGRRWSPVIHLQNRKTAIFRAI